MRKINYGVKKEMKNILDISLNSHDFVSVENNILSFWKNKHNDYFETIRIHLDDFKRVLDFMEIVDKSIDLSFDLLNIQGMNNGFPVANMEMNYTLVPKNYLGHRYYMKTFCRYILFSNKAFPNDSYDNDRDCIFWLPIDKKLWENEINDKKKVLDIKVFINGKLSNKPISYETAKNLGIIE